jgi:flagellar biosynthesis component FlhA
MNNYNYIKNMHDELLNKKETQDKINALKNDVFLLKDDITQLLDEYKKTEKQRNIKKCR